MPALFWTTARLAEMVRWGRSGGDWSDKPSNWKKGWMRYSSIADRAARAKAQGVKPRAIVGGGAQHHYSDKWADLTPLSSNVPAVPRLIGRDPFVGVTFPDCGEARRDRGTPAHDLSRPDYQTYTGGTL